MSSMWIKLLILVLKRGMSRRQNGSHFTSYFNIFASILLNKGNTGVGDVRCSEILWGADQKTMLVVM